MDEGAKYYHGHHPSASASAGAIGEEVSGLSSDEDLVSVYSKRRLEILTKDEQNWCSSYKVTLRLVQVETIRNYFSSPVGAPVVLRGRSDLRLIGVRRPRGRPGGTGLGHRSAGGARLQAAPAQVAVAGGGSSHR